MTVGAVPQARWGFCPRCERWRLSNHWEAADEPARCPVCGADPDCLEAFDGQVGSTVLHLILGPGSADLRP